MKLSRGKAARQQPAEPDSEESLQELGALARGAGAEVVGRILQVRTSLDAATLIGSGKVSEVAREAAADDVDTVIFDRDLTPTQLRNLEKALERKVVDRTQLILDIFARRARTREGQLQVELAQLNYLLPRLTGRGVEMSRLGGGIGTRGPGETQLETDRRRISRRIKKIREQLESVRRTRGVQRSQRQIVPLASVALVGYTNAGKSTLFNRLTGASVVADSRMFATLDPTARQIVLPSRRRAVLSDTVGFIRNLPTTLVQAFRATLEEVTDAAILVHVVDSSAAGCEEHLAHVIGLLHEIGASSVPQILALNKIDRVGGTFDSEAMVSRMLSALPEELRDSLEERPVERAVAISARDGDGLPELLDAVDRLLPIDPISRFRYCVPAGAGAELHLLHEYAKVLNKRYSGEFCEIEADVPESVQRRLERFRVTQE